MAPRLRMLAARCVSGRPVIQKTVTPWSAAQSASRGMPGTGAMSLFWMYASLEAGV